MSNTVLERLSQANALNSHVFSVRNTTIGEGGPTYQFQLRDVSGNKIQKLFKGIDFIQPDPKKSLFNLSQVPHRSDILTATEELTLIKETAKKLRDTIQIEVSHRKTPGAVNKGKIDLKNVKKNVKDGLALLSARAEELRDKSTNNDLVLDEDYGMKANGPVEATQEDLFNLSQEIDQELDFLVDKPISEKISGYFSTNSMSRYDTYYRAQLDNADKALVIYRPGTRTGKIHENRKAFSTYMIAVLEKNSGVSPEADEIKMRDAAIKKGTIANEDAYEKTNDGDGGTRDRTLREKLDFVNDLGERPFAKELLRTLAAQAVLKTQEPDLNTKSLEEYDEVFDNAAVANEYILGNKGPFEDSDFLPIRAAQKFSKYVHTSYILPYQRRGEKYIREVKTVTAPVVNAASYTFGKAKSVAGFAYGLSKSAVGSVSSAVGGAKDLAVRALFHTAIHTNGFANLIPEGFNPLDWVPKTGSPADYAIPAAKIALSAGFEYYLYRKQNKKNN